MEYTAINLQKNNGVLPSIEDTQTFVCWIPYANRTSDLFLSVNLQAYLEEIGRSGLHSHLEYALNELVMNASKANTKRLFFKSNELDIHNPDHYAKGMRSFKSKVFDHFEDYEEMHVKEGLYIKVDMAVQDGFLSIDVENNSPFTPEEIARIGDRVKMARKFSDLTEVLAFGFDEEEGAGYGLIMIILMLRKINLDEKSLLFHKDDHISRVSLRIPLNLIEEEHSAIIAEKIAQELKQMPSIPENVLHLQNELNNPHCNFESIAKTMSADPSFSAEVIRIANSPIYKVPNKIDTVAAAVRLVGMLGVKAILYNYGANKIFEMKYDKKIIQSLNDHSYDVALIASYLGKYKGLSSLVQDIYVGALLHDMGRIVISALQSDLSMKLQQLCADKHIPIAILEDLTAGYNHAVVGSELAKKWQFPEKYINAIHYHHIPTEVSDEFKVLTYTVYLGNEIYYYIQGERDLFDINYQVLEFFGMQSEDAFLEFVDDVKSKGYGV
ncbi:HDOD domain-containing protein [Spirochaeta cellobiosiphila]|uniref:HDOD domain-containing protein n=1 Tax=Spirochaeta cellobiosiphila TaxID=504483 RepID=UPI000416B66B|nr:HDOD domain-containing protein [Spirochaeta cellobiosiphila]